ncbi:DUF1998 domain-containing protein [Nonomuraea sp. NPDC052129]|uniref:DUF1998 domain-containing protein n=1 Tax=Nonomuraea sp. NPDC052129 TaxID=3154651 RepID=UPI00343B8BEA
MHDDRFIHDPAQALDPLGEVERLNDEGIKKNRAKVGSARPSSLLYTYGPGSIMDLPNFTVMPAGLDDWERIWARRDGVPEIKAPRLREVVRMMLGTTDVQLRPHPWQPKRSNRSAEGDDLGVPSRIFPQWMRCTGCDMLGGLAQFEYTNTHPFRPDLAIFEHVGCPGRRGEKRQKQTSGKKSRRPAVPARYLLVCEQGHLDEFPYDHWVHHWQACPEAERPVLKMTDRTAGKGASATIQCAACQARRPMNEAQNDRRKLPGCRGRHPHLDAFEDNECGLETRLMLVGASNLWFPATQSIIVMPETKDEQATSRADDVRTALGEDLADAATWPKSALRRLLGSQGIDLSGDSDDELDALLVAAAQPVVTVERQAERLRDWDPVDLLVPEWIYLQKDPLGPGHRDEASGLVLSWRDRDAHLPKKITRVLAVEKLRKVNALVGFTRVDDMDRAGDLPSRLVPLTRKRPKWTVATEDRGEGIFLQLDEAAVADWEGHVLKSRLWAAHRDANRRNFWRRFSETAKSVEPDSRLKPPRYWLVHTLAHVIIREAAMTCGYGAASLSERLYAWPAAEGRPPSAGLLICTTASDSDGTLGGLVQLSQPERLAELVNGALYRAERCSSDPICANRTPRDNEDFLHGAACHCCAMASETSCERANRFLDRRFLLDLPCGEGLGFFDHVS